ncbi:cytochrome P450 71D9-like [Tripterygium wilfordii]|uniref:Cytochrome P450 71D9-like n=1 Tax=Tripterygium wilfordii TaxID=458696 RepID=A0A7J7DUM0_TRIWF|nr:cytochrome P450 71D9-like [Tripterygium wilfordii]
MVGSEPHLALCDLVKKYGRLMYLQIGEVPTLVVFICKLRKISSMELFTTKRIQSFRSIKEQEMSKLINWVVSNATGGSPINLIEKVFSSTYTAVSRVALGGESKEKDELISVIKESSELIGGFNIQDVFSSLKLLHWISGVTSRLENFHQRSSNILQNIINQHIKSKATPPMDGKSCEQAEDLVDLLLNFHKPNAEFQLTVNNIKTVIQVCLFIFTPMFDS